MRSSIFGLLLGLSLTLSSWNSWSAGSERAKPTQVQSKIEQLVFGPNGQLSGLVLSNQTWVNFKPESLKQPDALRPGEVISVTGTVSRSKPNPVLNHVVIKKGDHVLADDSLAHPPGPPNAPSGPKPGGARFLSKSASILAVGAREDGKVDRFLLKGGKNEKNGTTVQLPPGGYIETAQLKDGEKVALEGVSRKFEGGEWIDAMNVENEKGQSLLTRKGENGEHWKSKSGTIQQALITPQGNVEGVLLADQSLIRFPLARMDQLKNGLTQGTQIWTAGPTSQNETHAQRILLTQQGEMLDFTVPRSLARSQAAGQASAESVPGEKITPAALPLQDEAEVRTIIRSQTGAVETLILNDGVVVKIPPFNQSQVPSNLKAGDLVSVQGNGGQYPLGTAIEANSIRFTNYG